MSWGEAYQAERGNLTSLLGTLAQLKENKKNRRSALLGDLLGIGAGIGGAALQNKWNKQAVEEQRPYDLALRKYEQEQENQRDYRQGWREEQAANIGHQRALEILGKTIRGEKDVAAIREDKERPSAWQIAATVYGEELSLNPELADPRNRDQKQFDRLRTLIVLEGTAQGQGREQMEKVADSYLRPLFNLPTEQPAGQAGAPGDRAAAKAARAAARAEEGQKKELSLTEVQQALQKVNALPGGRATQPALAINTGMLQLPWLNSRQLTDVLEQLRAAEAKLLQPTIAAPVDPVVERLRGLPGAAPGAGFVGGLDLSKARW